MSLLDERWESYGDLLDKLEFPPDELVEAARASVEAGTVPIDHVPLDEYGQTAQARVTAARRFMKVLGMEPSPHNVGVVAEELEAIGHRPDDDPELVVGLLRDYIAGRRAASQEVEPDDQIVVIDTVPSGLFADVDV